MLSKWYQLPHFPISTLVFSATCTIFSVSQYCGGRFPLCDCLSFFWYEYCSGGKVQEETRSQTGNSQVPSGDNLGDGAEEQGRDRGRWTAAILILCSAGLICLSIGCGIVTFCIRKINLTNMSSRFLGTGQWSTALQPGNHSILQAIWGWTDSWAPGKVSAGSSLSAAWTATNWHQ